jgi:hypothetical protein
VSALLYYTHNSLPREFAERIYHRHRAIAEQHGHQWVSVCRVPFRPGEDLEFPVAPDLPAYADIYRRILAGLDMVAGDDGTMVYLVEHDVLYCPGHFRQEPRGLMVFYNLNIAYMCAGGYFLGPENAIALSQLCGTKAAMRLAICTKLNECLERRMACIEPAGAGYITGTWKPPMPNIDIRTGLNTTWKVPEGTSMLAELPGWAPWSVMWDKYKGGLPE